MSYYYSLPLVIEAELAEARRALGTGLPRILGYYREDGARSITQIEQALATGNAAAMVIPAHTLKGESRQFGAQRLGDIAETIEKTARRCVEQHAAPADVATEIAMLRGCFTETLAALDATAPALPSPQPVQATSAPIGLRSAASLAGVTRTFGRRNPG